MAYEHIVLERQGGIATVTINRPAIMNALAGQSWDELNDAIDEISSDGISRVLLMTGSGRAFCSGADLGGVDVSGQPRDLGAAMVTKINPLLKRLHRLRMPIIAAVNGGAVGGGCGLALAGDFVIAARSAYFLLSFAKIGLVPDVGATWLLPRLIGKPRATAAMMLGERIPAEQAVAWGMIYQVVDDGELMAISRALAERLATGPTVAYGLTRQGISEGLEMTFSDALAMEARHQTLAGKTDDFAEGVAAFREKRAPVFRGS